jgi:hypothetical protein
MKRVYNVSYDLNKSGKDYKGLHEVLKSSFDYLHLLDSTWLLYTSESSAQIYNRIKAHIDSDDYILISQVTNNMQGWLPQNDWNWIKSRVGVLVG